MNACSTPVVTSGRVFAALALLTLVGCNGTPEGRMKVYRVSGKVTMDGQPASGADVVLHPTFPFTDKNADYPRGGIGADGSFVITTYDDGDGAPAGSYKVAILKGGDSESESLSAKKAKAVDLFKVYKDPDKSGLTAVVKESTTELPPFELKSPAAK